MISLFASINIISEGVCQPYSSPVLNISIPSSLLNLLRTIQYKIKSNLLGVGSNMASNHTPNPNSRLPLDQDIEQEEEFDYSKRSQWLRAAVLGANDGLVSTASLMMGVGAVKHAIKAMILAGFAGLVAGACSMAIGEFVSVYSQLDTELAQMRREKKRAAAAGRVAIGGGDDEKKEGLPNPIQAAAASALAFSVGAMVPLLAASFITEYKVRVAAVVAAVSGALVAFGWLGAALGRAPVVRSTGRVLIGGWLAMALTFGLTKLIGSKGL